MKYIPVIIMVLAIAFMFPACGKEMKSLKEELRVVKEENNFLKAENIALKKEVEELYKKLEEKEKPKVVPQPAPAKNDVPPNQPAAAPKKEIKTPAPGKPSDKPVKTEGQNSRRPDTEKPR